MFSRKGMNRNALAHTDMVAQSEVADSPPKKRHFEVKQDRKAR